MFACSSFLIQDKMSDQPKKRHRDEEGVNQPKQIKTVNVPNIEPITQFRTKLTDVNDDCLEKVFMHLSLKDLLNIAHTNKKLKTAADMVFAHKFGKKWVNFKINTFRQNAIIETGWTGWQFTDIYYLKTALRLLRCYGHLISNLSITFCKPFRTALVKVLHYTNLYCFETLKSIRFSDLGNHIFQTSMEKSFLKVEVVECNQCVFREKIMKLNTWFPAMRRLELSCCSIADPTSIVNLFSLLEELNIFHCESSFTPENVMTAFRLNPQLRQNNLDATYFSEHLQMKGSQLLPVLENLMIRKYSFSPAHFKSFRRLNIDFSQIHNGQSTLPRINMSFDQFEEVEMDLYEYKIIDEAFDFFKKYPSITELTLTFSPSKQSAVLSWGYHSIVNNYV